MHSKPGEGPCRGETLDWCDRQGLGFINYRIIGAGFIAGWGVFMRWGYNAGCGITRDARLRPIVGLIVGIRLNVGEIISGTY